MYSSDVFNEGEQILLFNENPHNICFMIYVFLKIEQNEKISVQIWCPNFRDFNPPLFDSSSV